MAPAMQIALSMASIGIALTVKGITGFGSGLLTVTLLTLIWGPRDAIAISACTEIVACSILVPQAWRAMDAKLLVALFLPMMLGLWIGTGLLAVITDAWLTVCVGGAVALSGMYLSARPVAGGRGELDGLPTQPAKVLAIGGLAGFLGGLLGGLTTASGPPVIIYGRYFFTDAFGRAQFIGLFFLSSATLLPMLIFRGVIQADGLWRLPFLIPPMFLGAALGAWLSPNLSREQFGRLVGFVLAGAGLALLKTSL